MQTLGFASKFSCCQTLVSYAPEQALSHHVSRRIRLPGTHQYTTKPKKIRTNLHQYTGKPKTIHINLHQYTGKPKKIHLHLEQFG